MNTHWTNRKLVKPTFTLEECKKILNVGDEKFTDEEIIEIRDLLLALAEIDFIHFQKEIKSNLNVKTTINFNTKRNPGN